jgi:hypothetical protein
MSIEITRLGVAIDPTGAVTGAERAKRAARDMGTSIDRDLDRVEKASKDAGRQVSRAGQQIEGAAKDARREVDRLGQANGFDRLRQSVRGGFGDLRDMVIDLLDVFGLLDNGFGNVVRRGNSLLQVGARAQQTFGQMGQGANTAANGLNAAATASTATAGGLGRMLAAAGPMIGILAAVAAGVLALVVAFKALHAATAFVASSVREAAALEQYTVRLAVLQGSFESAAATVKRFNAFSDSTPFLDAEVFDAGTKLEAMTRGVLSTDEALRAIGGSAFVAGKQFSEIAELVGRSYNAMRLGMDFIEPLKTMNSYGLITGETVKKVIALGEAAEKTGNKSANFAQQWALVYGELQEKQEALILASGTWEGKMSTIEGKWQALKAELGAPVMEALSPLLDQIISLIQIATPYAAALGQTLGNMLKGLIQVTAEGQLGALLAASLMDAIETAARFLLFAFLQSISMAANHLVNLFMLPIRITVDAFQALMGERNVVSEFALNLKNVMIDAVTDFGNYLLEKAAAAGVAMRNAALSGITGLASGGIPGMIAGVGGAAAQVGTAEVAKGIADAVSAKVGEVINGPAPAATLPVAAPMSETDPNFVGPPSPVKNDYFSTSLFPDNWMEKAEIVTKRQEAILHDAINAFDAQNPAPVVNNPVSLTDPVVDPTGGLLGTGTGGDPSATARKIENITDVLQEQKSALGGLMDEWGNLGRQADQALTGLTQKITGEFSTALTDAIMGTKSWEQAFQELGASVVRSIIEMVTQMWVQYAVQMLLNQVSGSFGGGLGGIFGGASAAVLHSGGSLDGAPRRGSNPGLSVYHSGGRASSERLAMLEKNETVLTAEQGTEIRDRIRGAAMGRKGGAGGSGGGGTPVTILNVTDPGQVAEAIASNPDVILNAINSRLPQVKRMLQSGDRR